MPINILTQSEKTTFGLSNLIVDNYDKYKGYFYIRSFDY